MRRVPFLLTIPALSVALWACAGSGAPGSSSITKDSLSADVYAISADSMRGRLVGTREDSEAGKGWTPASFAATASALGPVVYAGYGIVEPHLGWDDYKGKDARGKRDCAAIQRSARHLHSVIDAGESECIYV